MDERKLSSSYLSEAGLTRNFLPKVEGKGWKATKGSSNDCMSQLSDSGDEIENQNRSGDTIKQSKKLSHRSEVTVRRTSYNKNHNNYHHFSDPARFRQEREQYTHDVRSSSIDSTLPIPIDHHRSFQEFDTSSTLAHAPESVAGDIDTRSLSSLHHDITIHVEYPESTGSFTSDHKDIESVEHSFYTSATSRGRTESFGYPSDRSAIHQGAHGATMDQDYFPSTMSCKSDIATVCSGSVIEDIEVSSVLSNDMGGNIHLSLSRKTSSEASHLEGDKFKRNHSYSAFQKHDRSVEFSLDALGNPAQRLSHHNTDAFFQSFPLRLNTMGPPLNRSILLSAALTGDCQNSFEVAGSSRPGSVKSFASDNVFVDTDDCGGSIVESDGRASVADEHHSVHSHEHAHSSPADVDGRIKADNERPEPTDLGQLHNLLLEQGISGRVSPGGTIYKGRGVRKYQGRYMNLPLKRFSADSTTQMDDYNPKELDHHHMAGGLQSDQDRRGTERSSSTCHERSRRSYRNRSRSWSRETGESNVHTRNIRRRSRSRSPSLTADGRDGDHHRRRKSGGFGRGKRNNPDSRCINRSYNIKNSSKNEWGQNEPDSSGRGWGYGRNKAR